MIIIGVTSLQNSFKAGYRVFESEEQIDKGLASHLRSEKQNEEGRYTRSFTACQAKAAFIFCISPLVGWVVGTHYLIMVCLKEDMSE